MDTNEENAVQTKLSAARTRLILERPFLGALVLRLPLVEGDPEWCKSTATDARSIYYNYEYIHQLNQKQTQFMLAHDALHCALSHFARRHHRNKHRWDVACDFAINAMLITERMQPPADVLYLEAYSGMTAEEIYPLLSEDEDREPTDQHLYDDEPDENSDSGKNPDSVEEETQKGRDQGNGDQPSRPQSNQSSENTENEQSNTHGKRSGASKPKPLTTSEMQDLEAQWQKNLAGAAQQAMQAGKMGDALARLVDHFLQPQLPWRMLLAHYMTASAREDYNYARPSSRRSSEAIFPSLRSGQLNVTVVLDTSGSISDDEIAEFLGEVNGIKGQIRARVTLLSCDQEVADPPLVIEPWEELKLQTDICKGGRGTSFIPAFEYAEKQEVPPDLLLYFTDAAGEFPQYPPNYPVLWLIKGKNSVPWGQRIQLNGE